MLTLLLPLALVLGGGATHTNKDKCYSHECGRVHPMDELLDLAVGQNELITVCPTLKEFFPCMRDHVYECTGKTFEEIIYGDDEKLAERAQRFLSKEELASDLCNPDTQLHKAQLRHASCFYKVKRTMFDECFRRGKQVMDAYLEFLGSKSDTEMENANDEDDDIRECIWTVHFVACLSAVIDEECGQEARETFQEIVKRAKVIRQTSCTEEQFAEVKSAYIDSLTEEGESRDRLISFFDTMKKK